MHRLGSTAVTKHKNSCRQKETAGMEFPQYDRHFRAMIGLLRCLSHPCPNGIEIHIGHTGRQGFFIQQGLGFVSALQIATGATILLVGLARDRFVDAAHEPADIMKTLTPIGNPVKLGCRDLKTHLFDAVVSCFLCFFSIHIDNRTQ